MPSSSSSSTGAESSRWIESDTRLLCDLLDTLIAIRIDVGRVANGIAASPGLGTEQLPGIRAMLDHAIASTKGLLGSTVCPPQSSSDNSGARPS